MNTTRIVITDSDLSSRRSGAVLRVAISERLRTGIVELDLANVKTISSSYADELFGVFVQEYGVQELLQKVRFGNARPEVLKSIAAAIRYRLEATVGRSGIDLALLTAKRFAEKRAA